MTLRLSNLFEEQMKKIFKRSSSRLDRPARPRNERRRPVASSSQAHTNGGPSTSRQYTRMHRQSSDEDEEIDVVNGETPSTSTGRPMRQIRARQTNQQITNGVSSSHNEAGPSGNRNKRTRHLRNEHNLSELSSESSESDSSNASETYNPNEPKSSRRKVKKKDGRINGATPKRPRRLVLHESTDDEHPQESETLPISSQNGRRTRGRQKISQIIDDESENEESQNETEAEEEQSDEDEEEEQNEVENEGENEGENEDNEDNEDNDEEEENVEQESYRPRRSTRQSPIRSTRRRSSRRNHSDDSDTQPLRPRRAASKRWAQDEDSLDETNEETPTSTRRSATNTQHQVNFETLK